MEAGEDIEFRLLFVTLEFTFSPFSGNGVYARSIVKSLLRTGGKCAVRVICGRPYPRKDLSPDNPIASAEISVECQDSLEVWPVDLPEGASWKRLDKLSPWEEFSQRSVEYAEKAARWKPHAALVVDWHGGAAWQNIVEAWPKISSEISQPPKVCYFNFRVYSSGFGNENADGDVIEWYERLEKKALELSSEVICLSCGDCDSLSRLLPPNKSSTVVKLLHPALREDMRVLTANSARELYRYLHPEAVRAISDMSDRIFVTCAVRLSREKNPLLFIQVMEILRDFMRERGLVPLLCGSASDEAYAAYCRERLLASYPTGAVVIDDFMGPSELAAIFSRTLVNFHPCIYDAYGMTAVEATAFGAPSFVNGSGCVGAAEFLGKDGCFQVNMNQSADTLAASVKAILDSTDLISKVSKIGSQKAVTWSEEASGGMILSALHQLSYSD